MKRTLSGQRSLMYKKLMLFLLVVIALVAALVYYDRTRTNPWGSDVFFGSSGPVTGTTAT